MEETKVYEKGNDWQRNRYAFMSDYNIRSGVTDLGCAKGGDTKYYHLLTEKDKLKNFLGEQVILNAVEERFKNKAGDYSRVLTNTVASQPCCFNLFVPLQINKELAGRLFSELLDKQVKIDELIIEFTPEKRDGFDETLGDQSKYGGTDSDVAVKYSSGNSTGIIIIEFKYIESEFSVCTSFKEKKHLKDICTKEGFHSRLIDPFLINRPIDPDCGYLRYQNWQLTGNSEVFDIKKVKENIGCPFRYSGQQLWRNMLLAENVASQRNLDEFHFWVIAPAENTYLWNSNKEDTEKAFSSILTEKGNECFRKLELKKDFIDPLKSFTLDRWTINWIKKFEARYLT